MMRCRTIGSRIINSQIMSLLHQDRRVLAIVRWSGWMTVHSPPRTRHTHNTTRTHTTTPPRSGRRFRSLRIQSDSRLIRPRLGDQHLLLPSSSPPAYSSGPSPLPTHTSSSQHSPYQGSAYARSSAGPPSRNAQRQRAQRSPRAALHETADSPETETDSSDEEDTESVPDSGPYSYASLLAKHRRNIQMSSDWLLSGWAFLHRSNFAINHKQYKGCEARYYDDA